MFYNVALANINMIHYWLLVTEAYHLMFQGH